MMETSVQNCDRCGKPGELCVCDHEKDALRARIAELEARLSAVIAGEILPADAADEIVVDGVKWLRVPAERRVVFVRDDEE